MTETKAGQLDLFAIADEDEDADLIDDGDTLEVVRRWVKARAVPMPKGLGPASIWDLGRDGVGAELDQQKLHRGPRVRSRVAAVVDLGEGRRRVVGAAYPPRWTGEDFERERLRRAKQRPPKPTKKAKTRSRKLLELIGPDDGADE